MNGSEPSAAASEPAPVHPARLPFACEGLRKEGAELVYRCAKQHSEPGSDKLGARVDKLILTPLELKEVKGSHALPII